MLHEVFRKNSGPGSASQFTGQDFHKPMCHRQTRWRIRTLPRRLASWHCSSNSKPDQSAPCSIHLIPGAVLIWQACYRSQACQAHAHLDLGSIGQKPFRSDAAKPLRGQLTSRRDKILLDHCVCRSFNDLHLQNRLAGPGPAFFRKFCVAWVMMHIDLMMTDH